MSQVELTTFPQQPLDTSRIHQYEEWPRISAISSSIHDRHSLEQHPGLSHPQQEFSLPPADGGKDAWLFLAAAFVVEALVWGKSRLSTCIDLCRMILTDIQDFRMLLVYFKNIILHMNHSWGPLILHLLALVHW
jgi:hypothetical protein